MWNNCYNSFDLNLDTSIYGFEELKKFMVTNQIKEKEKGFNLKAALSEMFIQSIDSIIIRINEKIQDNK